MLDLENNFLKMISHFLKVKLKVLKSLRKKYVSVSLIKGRLTGIWCKIKEIQNKWLHFAKEKVMK